MRKSPEIRELIVADRKNGKTLKEIAEKYNISAEGARLIIKRHKETGNYDTLYGGGRKRKINEHQTRMISRKVSSEPMTSARALIEDFGLNVSESTMRRKLRTMVLNNYIAKKKTTDQLKKSKEAVGLREQVFEHAAMLLGQNYMVERI